MDATQRDGDEVFEAVLITGPLEKLEKASDTVSDLLDLFHETKAEILSFLSGTERSITETRLTISENNLVAVQSYLNTLWIARSNAKTIE